MVPWHVDYFKLIELGGEKNNQVLKELWNLPLNKVLDPHVGVAFPIPEGKVSLNLEKCQEESEQTSLAKFPPIYYT